MAVIGKPTHKFAVFTDDKMGSLEVFNDGLVIRAANTLNVKFNYIDCIEKNGDLPLNKVSVTMAYYDLFGNKECFDFAMREHEFRTLKAVVKK
ncbi:hypothetical protein HY991_00015 [Candidatus Micrarchaeota archaeon]|nr:hypothetical protein [Candidatus Micrarchaeota archaeon]